MLNSRLLPLIIFFVFHSPSQYGAASKGRLDQHYKAAGVPPEDSAHYASAFGKNRLTELLLLDLTKEYLKAPGITIIGDITTVLKYIEQSHQLVSNNSVITTNPSNSRETIVTSTNISPPQLQAEMTHPQF